jgi:hypothetical protein
MLLNKQAISYQLNVLLKDYGRLKAISALALTHIIYYYSSPTVAPNMLNDSEKWFTDLMEEDDLQPSLRGHLTERYIIQELIRRRESPTGVQLPIQVLGRGGATRVLVMSNYDVLYFE